MTNRVALIPARGGSKRLPRKNIVSFLGKPIIAYTIAAAKATSLFSRVVVSTEDAEIADIAKQYGAEVDVRSPELATDQATTAAVCHDFLARHEGIDILTVLYATSPLRTAADIKSVVALLSSTCHSAMAVTECSIPVHQLLCWEQNKVTPLFPQWVANRSPDDKKFVVDNGSTYAVAVPEFLKHKTFYGHDLQSYLMPSSRSVDIDSAADLALALYYAQIDITKTTQGCTE